MSLAENVPALVHEAVSKTNELALGIEVLLTETPKDTYEIPRETLDAIRTILTIDSLLVTNLFEENQETMDRLEKIISDHQ